MAAVPVSRLNAVASPFIPTALLPAGCYYPSAPPATMPAADFFTSQFLYPQPPHPQPPAYGWPAACGGGSWCPSGGFTVGVPAFPQQAACVHPLPPPAVMVYYCAPPPPPPSASRCQIAEIFEDGGEAAAKVELRDEPSPRSVLATWSRDPTSPPAPLLPPPRPTSFVGRALPHPRRWPLLAFNPSRNITSLMIRNIPNKFVKKRVMAIIDQHCAEENAKLAGDGKGVKSEYDFLYVPVDFETRYNKGYAFVNMTTGAAARRLHAHLHGHIWAAACSRKICDVVNARLQGLDALVAHFSGTRFPSGGDKEFLPVRFVPPRDGVRETAEHVVGRILHRHHG